jgi:hypothetical protein
MAPWCNLLQLPSIPIDRFFIIVMLPAGMKNKTESMKNLDGGSIDLSDTASDAHHWSTLLTHTAVQYRP